MESMQLLNTAIIKSKEKNINKVFESRLSELSDSPAVKALDKAISILAEDQQISRDQASVELIDTLRELDQIWNDYVTLEGIDRLKSYLGGEKSH
jgi:hypothetical protein